MPIPALTKNYTSGLLAVGAGALLTAGVVTSPAVAAPGATDSSQISICHQTGSGSHPYEMVPTAKSSIVGSRPRFENDIFPPFVYTDSKGQVQQIAGQNWDAAGQAMYANGCVPPTVTPTPSVTPTVVPTVPPTVPPTQTSAPTTAPAPTSPVPSTSASDPVVTVDPSGTSAAPTSAVSTSAAPTTTAPTTQQSLLPVVNDSSSSASTPAASATSSTATTPASPPAGGSGTPAAGGQAVVQAAGAAQAPGQVSLRAQTAASAPAADPTASNAFFASGALMLLGAFIPRLSKGRRGRHS